MEDVNTNPADDFPVEEGPQAKPDPKKQVSVIADARAEWKAANAYHRECERALAVAKDRLNAAGRALSDSRPQLTLSELNAQQRKVTKTEARRRIRAQETLDALAMSFNPKRQPHPPLFDVEKPKE
ncbi:MAG: hypothetical protein V3T08_09745 [Gemmatimonadota bacterium]